MFTKPVQKGEEHTQKHVIVKFTANMQGIICYDLKILLSQINNIDSFLESEGYLVKLYV